MQWPHTFRGTNLWKWNFQFFQWLYMQLSGALNSWPTGLWLMLRPLDDCGIVFNYRKTQITREHFADSSDWKQGVRKLASWPLALFKDPTVAYDFNWPISPDCGSGSSVGIATDYGLDRPGSNRSGDEVFRPSRPAPSPTNPSVKWVPCLSQG